MKENKINGFKLGMAIFFFIFVGIVIGIILSVKFVCKII